MAYLDDLIATQANLASLLRQATTNPKPNYSLDGETYWWADYVAMLRQQLAGLALDIQNAGGPYEVNSHARS